MANPDRAIVVGAGTMGHGIAQVCARAGIETTLVDVDQARLDQALSHIAKNLDVGIQKNKLTPHDKEAALAQLSTATSTPGGCDAGLLIEAVPEQLDLKKTIFEDAGQKLPPEAILATNTSSLPVTEIAACAPRPENVVGLHFFNPVHIMKLLEIVAAAQSSEDTLAFARRFAERIGKTAIVVKDAPGFATSRLGITLGNEAMRMVEEGVASPADIDTALKLGYGHPMGPLALSDLVGLDVRLHITEFLHAEIGTDGFLAPRILRRLVRAGCLGKKTEAGFYLWKDGAIDGINPLVMR